ncbi:MAG: Rne/Rng family ribonuclease [Rhizobiaceae bacterium]|nr:Rne/Rng family ribonuclease [Rhizobiaceae bacterium]
MPNKMLVDATHPEETRVVVLRGNRVEEFDYESANRKQLRGNIYLAKVTRVEPSLQAAFVEYGGNRHGFLAFSEIHPDYYQIPTADRQALLEDEARAHRDEEDEHERKSNRRRGRHRDRGARRRGDSTRRSEPVANNAAAPTGGDEAAFVAEATQDTVQDAGSTTHEFSSEVAIETNDAAPAFEPHIDTAAPADHVDEGAPVAEHSAAVTDEVLAGDTIPEAGPHDVPADMTSDAGEPAHDVEAGHDEAGQEEADDEEEEEEHVEIVGGADAMEEAAAPRVRHRRREYKIQEVIKRRQVMLVQVVKEERGTKGAALTTYLSLAGRYSVLMPNTARGGGISRKITSAEDRRRMKEMVEDLQVPEGMGIILRTAGQNRTKTEIKRDFEYLLRVWEQVRDLTLQSTAPTLVYEEGSLTKRSIRDLYNKDIDEVIVAGERGYRDAKDFMRMLMPSHARNVKLYRDSQPIFTRYGIESQLDAMFSPTVQLKSGGYIVINQTEALVAIDVNSGRATREHHIEDTATKTNLEAADEVARQLRLRDLAGLIVIDFIDMDEGRNNRTVERRMKEALKHDRARIQVGRISHFGLLEMSRQRIRASVLESTMQPCPHCGGTGHVRSDSSVALLVLRAIEEFLLKDSRYHLTVKTPMATALYVLNHKRRNLADLETKFGLSITIEGDEHVGAQHYAIFKGALVDRTLIQPAAPQIEPPALEPEDEDVVEVEAEDEEEAVEASEARPQQQQQNRERDREDGEGGRRRRRRRRRRGGRDRDGEHGSFGADAPRQDVVAADAGDEGSDADDGDDDEGVAAEGQAAPDSDQPHGDDGNGKRRRRGKRGGRRNRHGDGGFAEAGASDRDTAEGEASGDVVALNGDADAETAAPAPAPEVPAEATVEVVADAAEKPARRSRKKAASSEDGGTAEAKPARSRSRKRAAEPEATAEPVAEAPASVAAETTQPIEVAATPEPEQEVAPEPAKPTGPVVTSTAEPDAPRKGGWWQRRGFF